MDYTPFFANAYEPFYICFLIMCLVITIQVYTMVGDKVGKISEVRAFKAIILVYIVYILDDAVWLVLSYNTGYITAIKVLEVVQAGILALFTYCWFAFAEVYIDGFVSRSATARRIFTIPAIMATVITAFMAIYDVGFYEIRNGVVGSDWLYVINFCIDCFYMFFALVHTLIRLGTEKNSEMRRKCKTILECVAYPAIGGFASIFISYTPLIILGILPSIIKVIIEAQNSHIYTDALTGMNNRARVYDYLEKKWQDCSPATPITIYMMDLNSFKSINDRFGHLEGDRALVIVAEVLKDASHDGLIAGRYGGDEFILCDTAGIDPEMLKADIKETLKDKVSSLDLPYSLTISVGYCTCISPNKTITEIQKRADDECYRDKTHYHKITGGGGIDKRLYDSKQVLDIKELRKLD